MAIRKHPVIYGLALNAERRITTGATSAASAALAPVHRIPTRTPHTTALTSMRYTTPLTTALSVAQDLLPMAPGTAQTVEAQIVS